MKQYRADIDGLRALAVIPVLIFHFFPSLLPGGFVGVDVFFVISGFLITSIIINDVKKGTFTVLGFYKKRIIRIFPALTLVLSTVYLLGWFSFLQGDFASL
ncbi:acyltransferase, partial [Citrobacter freundii]|nr:acyltransferase [Citrobacter freundii]